MERYQKMPRLGKKMQTQFRRGYKRHSLVGEIRLSVADAACGFSQMATGIVLF